MNLREVTERREEQYLSPYAARAGTARRKRPCEQCDIRTDFQRDRDRITHCKAFRRLMHKTQVFISPEGDHFRTRLTHTLEVAQISRTIARALALNEDLTEAIALGHDLGHTPFGHTGEDALDKILPGGFRHNEQSIRVVEQIENSGKGLNLTIEVLDGILNHRSVCTPGTLEGKIVQVSDKIAYINHDIDDAIRGGLLKPEALPGGCVRALGSTSRGRIDFLIRNIIKNSAGVNDIRLDKEAETAMLALREFLQNNVYGSHLQMKERNKITHMFSELHGYFSKHAKELPEEFAGMLLNGQSAERVAGDYIACMTDRYALRIYNKIFVPSAWEVL
ncbi:MAG: deoxyguanosinetriphosphate triphosphohydrolase [Clostridiales bacterium]|jgi:dGTPase|nr:deoxyguanosinetriphosphate triphosphohydrolase [Clostridiales bacterium]